MVLSAFSHAKAMIGSPLDATNISRGYSRVAFGVQGYVEELPASFDHRVVLVGRPGIAAATMAWGQVVRRRANTTRLNLDQDILNRKVTYWTDNGAYFWYERQLFLLLLVRLLLLLTCLSSHNAATATAGAATRTRRAGTTTRQCAPRSRRCRSTTSRSGSPSTCTISTVDFGTLLTR